MNRSSRLIALTAAIMMIVSPLATAAEPWKMFGSVEPDHQPDLDDDLQWGEPPGATSNRVYFNGITFMNPLGTNPNVAELGTTMEVVTLETYNVFLGVWVDCNGDGYVGMAQSAMREYPSSALVAPIPACEPVTGPEDEWVFLAPNYNGWVSEFMPIGQTWKNSTVNETGDPTGIPDDDDNDNSNDLRIIRDPHVKVWGDYGYPHTGVGAQGTCALAPQPRGTYQTTGGMLTFADCATGLMERWNQVWIGGVKLGGQQVLPGLDPENEQGMKFDDPNNGNQEGHPLNHETFGTENSTQAPAHVSDCSDPEFVNSSRDMHAALDPVLGNETVQIVDDELGTTTVPNIAPSLGNTNPETMSVAALANVTWEETVLGDCDYTNDRGDDFYSFSCAFLAGACVGEADFNNAPSAGKIRSQWNFDFNDFGRGQDAFLLNFTAGRDGANDTLADVDTLLGEGDQVPDAPAVPFLFPGSGPSGIDGNAGATLPGFIINGQWDGGVQLVKRGPRTFVVNADEGTFEPSDAYNMTYYAWVNTSLMSDLGLALPGGSGTYSPCSPADLAANATVNGWICNRDAWYKNPDGTRQPEPPRGFARPGDTYNLRDIDCQDNQVVLVGIQSTLDKACKDRPVFE